MKKIWKRSKQTTELVDKIREAVLSAGFEEELAITPLADVYSIVVRKGDEFYNIRFKKDTLEFDEVVSLNYVKRHNIVVKVFRNKLS